jgi:hypothetical protein
MRKFSSYVVGLALAVTCVYASAAQEKAGSASVPKVLQITREYVKPGKAGMAHEKAESAFVDAMRRAKWPTYYIGMTSLSGKARALFLTSYESFDAWQKDTDTLEKNATLSMSLERAYMADGELLDSVDQGVFYFHEEMSLRPRPDLSQMRYLELNAFHVRPGKDKEWTEVVKMAKAGYEKGVPEAHWGMFEQVYGSWRDVSVVELPQVAGRNRQGLHGRETVRDHHGRRGNEKTRRTVCVLRGVYAAAVVRVQSAHELCEGRMDQGRP